MGNDGWTAQAKRGVSRPIMHLWYIKRMGLGKSVTMA